MICNLQRWPTQSNGLCRAVVILSVQHVPPGPARPAVSPKTAPLGEARRRAVVLSCELPPPWPGGNEGQTLTEAAAARNVRDGHNRRTTSPPVPNLHWKRRR